MGNCNFLCKIFCTLILIIAFVFNTIGNWVGIGDIIPTDDYKCPFGCTCHDPVTEESTTELTTEYTTAQPTATTAATATTQPDASEMDIPEILDTVEKQLANDTSLTPAQKEEALAILSSQSNTDLIAWYESGAVERLKEITAGSPAYASYFSALEGKIKDMQASTVTNPTTDTTKPVTTETTVKPTATTTKKPTTSRTSTTQKNTPDENTKATLYGKTFNYTFHSIKATSDGGYVACGSMSMQGASQPFAVKFDKNSEVVWEKTFTSQTATLYFESLAVLSNGSVVIAGYGYSTGRSEALIYALSESDGTILFSKSYSGSKSDMFNAVAPTADGFVAGGQTDSSDGDFAGATGNSAVLISFDTEGNPIWKKYLTGSKGASVKDIATDNSGNIFVSYLTASTDGDFASCEELLGGYIDTVIMKYDKNGAYKWDYVIATSGRDEFTEIAADGSGGCVVAGYYELIGAVIPNGTLSGIYNLGGIDSVIFYINSNGTLKWKKTLAGINDDYITDISKSAKGYAISGYTSSGNRDFAPIGNVGDLDGFACMINSSGTVTAMYSQAGTGEDAATCIAARTNNGKFAVAGRTKSADGNFEANTNKTTIYTGYIASYTVGTTDNFEPA